MEINYQILNDEAVEPAYASDGDVGLDLIATSYKYSDKYHYHEYGTGIAIEIPLGYGGFLFPRSSVSKTDLSLANCVGVVDPGYRGEIKLRFKDSYSIEDVEFNADVRMANEWPEDDEMHVDITTDYSTTEYEVGDKIAQLIIMPCPRIKLIKKDKLSKTIRGDKGFGSTGR